jgi:hypothetical protein
VKLSIQMAVLLSLLPLSQKAHGREAVCDASGTIFCDDFESGTLSLWQDGVDPNRHTITATAANVYSGSRALQILYPQGGNGGWLTRWFMPGYDRVFMRVYVKWERGWMSATNGGDKSIGLYGNRVDNQWSGFGKAGIKPSGTDFFVGMLVSNNWYSSPDPGELIMYSYFPDMAQAPDGMYWGNNFRQSDPKVVTVPDQWWCLEYELKANTPGLHDGYQRMWINDVLKGETLNMRWRDTTDVRINAAQITGSGGGPVTEHKWYDNVVVAAQKIGCMGAGPGPATDTTPPNVFIASPANGQVVQLR